MKVKRKLASNKERIRWIESEVEKIEAVITTAELTPLRFDDYDLPKRLEAVEETD